jgi:hypothetical protein
MSMPHNRLRHCTRLRREQAVKQLDSRPAVLHLRRH